MPLIAFGSNAVLALINRFPAIVWLGAAMLGWVAGHLVISDPVCVPVLGSYYQWAEDLAGPAGAVFCVAVAWLITRYGKPAGGHQ